MDSIDVEQPLSCCLCDCQLRVPLLLNCFHSICEKCAERNPHEITCPTCREVTPFENLTVNTFSIISQRVSRITNGRETCEWCTQENEKNLADWWCEECSQAMCEQCLKLHNVEFDTQSDKETKWLDTVVTADEFRQNVLDAANNMDEAFDDTCSESSWESSNECHVIISLVDALLDERSTVWDVQRRCGIHRMKSLCFCFQCNTMKCQKCLSSCLLKEHKTCSAEDKEVVAFSEVSMGDAQKALDTIVGLVRQQHDVMWLRYNDAISQCVNELLRKKKFIIDAMKKAYSDARGKLDTYFEAVCNERSAAKLHSSRVQQAVRYGKVLLENTRMNASRHQWQILLPRIRSLTNKGHQLLRKHSTTTLPVVEDSTMAVDDFGQDWFRCSVQPVDDALPTANDEESEYESQSPKEGDKGQVNIGITEGVLSDSCSSVCELPEHEIKRLISILTHEMNKISEKHGQFAYYLGKNMEVDAYVTSDTRCSTATLQAELENFLRDHISEQYVRVTVKEGAPVAVSCCGGVGSLLTVGGMEQVVGIYLQYQGRGTIYWVSSAHGLVKCSSESLHSNEPEHYLDTRRTTSSMHLSNRPKITARFSAYCPDLPLVDIPVPYIAMSYDALVLRGENRDLLCHSVDIMMGPTPLTNWHVSNYLHCKSSFISALDGCSQPLCCALHHTRGCPLYTISGIHYFEPIAESGCTTFLTHGLVGENLRCYLVDKGQLATGCVQSVYNQTHTYIRRRVNASVCMSQNMFLITPTGSCRPAEGHSGSVWVRQCESSGRYEAIAITCAVILPSDQPSTLQSDRCEAWLASPLCACLLALSEEYPERFADYKAFTIPD